MSLPGARSDTEYPFLSSLAETVKWTTQNERDLEMHSDKWSILQALLSLPQSILSSMSTPSK